MANNHQWLLDFVHRHFPERENLQQLNPDTRLLELWPMIARLTETGSERLAQLVAQAYELEFADLEEANLFATGLIPEHLARECLALPIKESGAELVIAIANPEDQDSLDRLRMAARRRLLPVMAPPEAIDNAITAVYSEAAAKQSEHLLKLDESADDNYVGKHPVTRLSKTILRDAIKRRASDVHVQPYAGGGLVRCRTDGLLHRMITLPAAVYNSLVRHIKAVSGMDPANDRVPQDGRMTVDFDGRAVEIRLSTLPSTGGERLVMRLLDQAKRYSLDQMRFPPNELNAIRRIIQETGGLLLVTGPTGSGKTTTLYSILQQLNRDGINIITLENPVEYRLVGISQVEVDETAGLSFAEALRSILRQDPDVVLVGEIRDAETAHIAIQAALTGHLVLSTLHTNSALNTIPRLVDLGVSAALLHDSLLGVTAQRLVRRLCPDCRTATSPDSDSTTYRIFTKICGTPPAAQTVGCKQCEFTGYLGRLPILEVLELDSTVRRELFSGDLGFDRLAELSKRIYASPGSSGVRSLAHVAASWIIAGETTPEEVVRVLGHSFWYQLAETYQAKLPHISVGDDDHGEALGGAVMLLVSPDQDLAEALQPEFTSRGFQLKHFTDHQTARAFLEGHPTQPTLIIIDVGTGDENSVSSIESMRSELSWSGIPYFVLVDSLTPEMKALAEKFRFTDYATRPLEISTLVSRIDGLINR